MSYQWAPMTVDEFAAFERILDPSVVKIKTRYWRRVRPFFYRPILPYQPYEPNRAIAPAPARLGGCQYVVPSPELANSRMDLLMFNQAGTYSLESLDYNRKRQVKLAAKQLDIRPVADAREFKTSGHQAYLSFFERTRYDFGAERTNQGFFARWVDQLHQIPKLIILGCYHNNQLGAVSISQVIENTLLYSTFFCHADCLRLYASDLMLHHVREAAARSGQISQIFAGVYKGGNGLDDFYLLRGCDIVRAPARLQLNPLAAFILRRFLRHYYTRMCGEPWP